MTRVLTILGALLGAVFLVFVYTHKVAAPEIPVLTSLSSYDIADTDAERVQGLSGRADIPEDYGLLFIFPTAGRYGFWMKDMLVSIDIIWLNESGTIIGIEHDVSPTTYPQTFEPPEPVRYVLEVRAGEAARKGWSIGTNLTFP